MDKYSSFKDMMDAGYRAISGIQTDNTLEPKEKEVLLDLDPTIEEIQHSIADLFAADEAAARQAFEARQSEQDTN